MFYFKLNILQPLNVSLLFFSIPFSAEMEQQFWCFELDLGTLHEMNWLLANWKPSAGINGLHPPPKCLDS